MKNQIVRRKLGKAEIVSGIIAMSAMAASAAGEPVDLTATGTTLAGYVAVGATAGLGIFAAKHGIRVILGAFKALLR